MAVLRESPWYEEIKQEGIQQTARNLLAMGLDLVQIAAVAGLTPEQIRQLQNLGSLTAVPQRIQYRRDHSCEGSRIPVGQNRAEA
jgi:hypothetical protein